jgi:pilus assembly protein FimV
VVKADASTALPAVAASTHVAAAPAAMPAASASAPQAGAAPAVAKPAPAKPVVTPAVKPAPVAEEDPWYMQTWAWGAGAVAVVGLLLLAMRGRSRKPAAVAGATGASSLADHFGTVPPSGHDGVDLDQDELLDQLAEHPDDVGLHLELVSLYYVRRDVEHFEAAVEAMHAHIADSHQPEWQDVVHMGEDLVPGHPLFAGAAPMPPRGADEHDALHHFDLDSYASERKADELPPVPQHAANHKVSEYHFDFDLTPRPQHGTAKAPAHESEAVMAGKDVEEELETHHASTWQFTEPAEDMLAEESHHEMGHLSDDPIDTKLDLARAYLDMGDPDGARAMLDEVMHEGTQMQKDVAKRLLDSLH